jgi:hypothetical protein
MALLITVQTITQMAYYILYTKKKKIYLIQYNNNNKDIRFCQLFPCIIVALLIANK